MRRVGSFGTAGFGLFAILGSHCSAAPLDEATATLRQPIIGGALADAADSPVVFLRGPHGTCSALLVAPNLAMTARHCASQLTEGQANCDASGNLTAHLAAAIHAGVLAPGRSTRTWAGSDRQMSANRNSPESCTIGIRPDMIFRKTDRANCLIPGIQS